MSKVNRDASASGASEPSDPRFVFSVSSDAGKFLPWSTEQGFFGIDPIGTGATPSADSKGQYVRTRTANHGELYFFSDNFLESKRPTDVMFNLSSINESSNNFGGVVMDLTSGFDKVSIEEEVHDQLDKIEALRERMRRLHEGHAHVAQGVNEAIALSQEVSARTERVLSQLAR